jgi:hypothetical protein
MPVPVDRTLELPDGQYLPALTEKSGIAIHHTVGGTARSTFEWWLKDTSSIGTAFLIGRDGTVHRMFDPKCWAWQFGLPWPDPARINFERRYIGIEIASEGGLTENEGRLYCFDRISPRTLKSREEAFDFGSDYRGYRYYDLYEEAQLDSLVRLVNELCDEFSIPRRVPANPLAYHGRSLAEFHGIIGHTMVRKDKTDPLPDRGLWEHILSECHAEFVDIESGDGADPVTPPGQMGETELDELFEHNVAMLNAMDVAAGSMVKALITELQRAGRDTCIRLHDPEPGGHAVEYDLLQGARDWVNRIGHALGFETVTNSRLVVRSE